jgi:hypothetical protein
MALDAALVKSGQPAIMNMGHGVRIWAGCITTLAMANIKRSMDGLSRDFRLNRA